MKIALLIFRFGPSHGSILQTFALTRVLEGMGHNVTIIDRQRPITIRNYYRCIKRIIGDLINFKLPKGRVYVGEYNKVIMTNLNLFINRQLKKQTITISRDSELCKIGKMPFQAFIVGSDQTWRPKYVHNIYNYYLNFIPERRKVKRIAYAVSFGTKDWEYNTEQESECRNLIRRFDAVSVREDDGVELCKNYFFINARHVLDPTLLLSPQDYLKVISKENKTFKYVGYNFLDINKMKMEIVDIVCNTFGVKKRQINSMTETPDAPIEKKIAPTIDSWISGIANADFVVADSFHATVFCILFQRPFITIANERRGLSRFTSLLKEFGLQYRLITEINQISEDLIRLPIDWEVVQTKINKLKDNSLEFLNQCLNN